MKQIIGFIGPRKIGISISFQQAFHGVNFRHFRHFLKEKLLFSISVKHIDILIQFVGETLKLKNVQQILLDFNLISEYKKQEYITAVQTGLDRNYQPMEILFSEIIEKSISASTGE